MGPRSTQQQQQHHHDNLIDTNTNTPDSTIPLLPSEDFTDHAPVAAPLPLPTTTITTTTSASSPDRAYSSFRASSSSSVLRPAQSCPVPSSSANEIRNNNNSNSNNNDVNSNNNNTSAVKGYGNTLNSGHEVRVNENRRNLDGLYWIGYSAHRSLECLSLLLLLSPLSPRTRPTARASGPCRPRLPHTWVTCSRVKCLRPCGTHSTPHTHRLGNTWLTGSRCCVNRGVV